MTKLIRIADLAKKLDLINPKNKKPLNHILRYWEKEFKFVKPKIINKLNRNFVVVFEKNSIISTKSLSLPNFCSIVMHITSQHCT